MIRNLRVMTCDAVKCRETLELYPNEHIMNRARDLGWLVNHNGELCPEHAKS
jgi:hypothetical protein